jgi:hypothetical protein
MRSIAADLNQRAVPTVTGAAAMLHRQLQSGAARVALLASAAVVGGSLMSACGSNTAGPLRSFTAQGQPLIDTAWTPVSPGQDADATAYVMNSGNQRVRLLSATVVPVPGYRPGVLDHVGVATTLGAVGVGTNWPPGVPVKAFRGASLGKGESRIIFGISGAHAGSAYAAAGIRITYEYQNREYSVVAWAGLMGCVAPPGQQGNADKSRYCNAMGNRLTAAVRKVAGLG